MLHKSKKAIAILLCLVVSLLSISSIALAEEPIKVLLNGTELSFDQPPILENDRTLVPMRGIFEALGATVEWEESTQTITSTKDDITIIMQIGKHSFTKNGQEITLDVPPKVVNDRTLVPVRAIAESFEAAVGWDGATSTVTITSKIENTTPKPMVTPKPTAKPAFSVPKIEYEYGPFTLTSYYSTGSYWDSINVDSFIISKCEMTSIGKYKLYANIRGTSDDSTPRITMRFYDSNDRVLGEVNFIPSVAVNEKFNVLDYTYVEQDIIENAVKTEFFSHSGKKAVYGKTINNNGSGSNSEGRSVISGGSGTSGGSGSVAGGTVVSGDSGSNSGNKEDNEAPTKNPDNNSSSNLEGYNKLKNELIKKGKANSDGSSYQLFRQTKEGSSFLVTTIKYNCEGDSIDIFSHFTNGDLNADSFSLLTLSPGQNPEIVVRRFKNGSEENSDWFSGDIEGETITNVYVEMNSGASETLMREYALREIEIELVSLNNTFTSFDLDVTREELGLPSSVKIE